MSVYKTEGSLRPENKEKAVENNQKIEIEWGYPEELGALPDMPAELIPEAHGIRKYVESIANAYNFQRCAPATMLILSLCGVIGSRAGVRPYQNQSKVFFPNTWGGIVAPSGSGKSPVMSAALAPLHGLSKMIDKERHQSHARKQAEKMMLERDIKQALKDGIKPEDVAKKQSNLENLNCDRGRYIVINDSTAEALGELMKSNAGGVILEKDELAGVFAQWDRDGAQGSREFYLETWEGARSYSIHRIKRGDIFIQSCTLSVIGGIQPAKLSKYISDAINQSSYKNDGLIQRLQMVVIPATCKYKAVDADTSVPDELQTFFILLDQQLEAATMASGNYHSVIFPSEVDATKFWIEWQNKWMAIVGNESEPHIVGHLSKYRSLFAGLSLVFCLINGRGKVAVSDMELAAKWCDYLSLHARKMYRCSEQGTPTENLAEKIKAGKVKDGGRLKELKDKNILGRNTRKVIDHAIDELVAANWIHVEHGSRGSKVIHINPAINIGGES